VSDIWYGLENITSGSLLGSELFPSAEAAERMLALRSLNHKRWKVVRLTITREDVFKKVEVAKIEAT
jgi:hypothetical protein